MDLSKEEQYYSLSGLATSAWGSSGWNFMFSSILGAYPVEVEAKNKEHILIKKHFTNMFESLGYTMPCVFCRNSYKIFIKELPIKQFTNRRIDLMYWLYLIKDKVNTKLIQQEQQCYNNEKKRLKRKVTSKLLTEADYYSQVEVFKKKTLKTVASPPFQEIIDKYEGFRAVCSNKAKTCALPN